MKQGIFHFIILIQHTSLNIGLTLLKMKSLTSRHGNSLSVTSAHSPLSNSTHTFSRRVWNAGRGGKPSSDTNLVSDPAGQTEAMRRSMARRCSRLPGSFEFLALKPYSHGHTSWNFVRKSENWSSRMRTPWPKCRHKQVSPF